MIFRLPAKYSASITFVNSGFLFFTPFLSLMLSFWMFGNKQLFGYSLDSKSSQTDVMNSHHTLGEKLQNIKQLKLTAIEDIYFFALVILTGLAIVIILSLSL